MHLKVYQVRGRWYWRLVDKTGCLVARAFQGMRTFNGAKDQARYVMEGLRNTLRTSEARCLNRAR